MTKVAQQELSISAAGRRRCACLASAALALALGGCDTWFGEFEGAQLEGDRQAALGEQVSVSVDPEVASIPVTLPLEMSESWPQAGGNAAHAPYRMAGSATLSLLWSSDIGSGADSENRLLAQPVVGGGRIYAMDSDGEVAAFDANTGNEVWRQEVLPEEEDEGDLGGGLGFWQDTLYVTTGAAQALALDPSTGAVIWETRLPGPSRAAPTIADRRVFAVTADNRTIVMDSQTGERLWSHVGASEGAGLLGAANPAVIGQVAIAPYTSGELYALRVENGRDLWSDTLASVRLSDTISAIAQIRARPVADGDRIYAISFNGRLAAIDLRTGGRLWEQNIGGISTPWATSDSLYVVDNDQRLFCLTRADGRARWVTQLPAYEDPEDHDDPIRWVGPVLVGERLVLASSDGRAVAVSPYDGTVAVQVELSGPVTLEPIAAGGIIYLLTDDANLLALR